MNEKVESIRGILKAMGVSPERVEKALEAITGQREEPSRRDEALLTPAELRTRLQVSSTSLWRMKGLPFVTVGSRRRYLWSEIEKYLADCQEKVRC